MSASTELVPQDLSGEPGLDRYDIEVVVPVYNEERDLDTNVRRLRRYLDEHLPFSALVTIADNASSDATPSIARALAGDVPGVRAVQIPRKGRGRALRTVWSTSRSRVVAYMDVDLSTDLDALLPLVAPLLSGHSDVAIGTRLAAGSRVVRSARRETISRVYNGLLRVCLRARFSDAQCGFKAVRADVARALLPLVEDDAWFFDTELLILAERNGFRIHEVPVDWVDDSDSRVDIVHTALADLRGMWRMARRSGSRRGVDVPVSRRSALTDTVTADLVRFVAIGSGSTLAYFALYLALRSPLGAIGANVVALVMCSAGNRAAHRRVTDPSGAGSTLLQYLVRGLAGFLVSLAFTTTALLVVAGVTKRSVPVEVAALVPATAAATVVRFWMLRRELAPSVPSVPSGVPTRAVR
jgi:glycosyltransferase involved in cell wall biosynthesis